MATNMNLYLLLDTHNCVVHEHMWLLNIYVSDGFYFDRYTQLDQDMYKRYYQTSSL